MKQTIKKKTLIAFTTGVLCIQCSSASIIITGDPTVLTGSPNMSDAVLTITEDITLL